MPPSEEDHRRVLAVLSYLNASTVKILIHRSWQFLLVTMITGGDDARFTKVLTDCVLDEFNPVTSDCLDGATISGDLAPILLVRHATWTLLIPV
jgi:hypothetical protein